jgi:NADPH:quinone reductase-like Zn-dependent oxidoreductase
VNIARELGARVIATTRREDRGELLRSLGAEHVVIDTGQIASDVRELVPGGADRVLDLVSNSVLARRRGGAMTAATQIRQGRALRRALTPPAPHGCTRTTHA